MNILLVEDDPAARQFLCEGLQAQGHLAVICGDGREGLLSAAGGEFDVLVVDRMLPGIDGLSLVRALRTGGVTTPAILLTALGGVADRVEGLRAGADDYLIKPFDLEELIARIEALARRGPLAGAPIALKNEDLELHRLTRKVSCNGRPIELTACEFTMLELLLMDAGRTVTKAMLLEQVFDLQARNGAAASAIIEPHISRLRAKLSEAGAHNVILTVRGRGYRIAGP